jgi:hypothetical protein
MHAHPVAVFLLMTSATSQVSACDLHAPQEIKFPAKRRQNPLASISPDYNPPDCGPAIALRMSADIISTANKAALMWGSALPDIDQKATLEVVPESGSEPELS